MNHKHVARIEQEGIVTIPDEIAKELNLHDEALLKVMFKDGYLVVEKI